MDRLGSTTVVTSGPLKELKQRYNVTVFPHFRDRLACDPLNFFLVYGNYEFKWDYTMEDATHGLFELVDAMVEASKAAFNAAVEHWRRLPPHVQRVHALRELVMLPSAPVSNSLLTTYLRKETNWGAPTRLGNPPDPPSLSQCGFGRPKSSRTPVVSIGSRGRRTSFPSLVQRSPARDRHEEDEEMMANLLKQWHPPHSGPRCRVILDIVASRKSLGEEPRKSRPYRLGQMVFAHVEKKYPSEVMSTFVGISDSAMTLVGRDILFPYRATAGSGAAVPSRHGSRRMGSPVRSRVGYGGLRGSGRTSSGGAGDNNVAGISSTDQAGSSGAAGHNNFFMSNMEKMLMATIPCPRMVTSQPTNVERVDNIRLLVCFPPIEEESVS